MALVVVVDTVSVGVPDAVELVVRKTVREDQLLKSPLDGVLVTYCTLWIVVQVGLNICHKEVTAVS